MALFVMNWVLQVLTITASLTFLLCAASSQPSISSNSSTQLPSTIKYYVHALNSGAASVTQPVNMTSWGSFGQTAVFAYNIREGSDLTSKKVGTIRGFEIYNSMAPNETTILLLNTIVYDDGVYSGSISLHGQGTITETDYELSIVGGTGSFRGAAGYATIHNLKTAGNDHVFEHKLHFLWASSSF